MQSAGMGVVFSGKPSDVCVAHAAAGAVVLSADDSGVDSAAGWLNLQSAPEGYVFDEAGAVGHIANRRNRFVHDEM